MNNNLELLHGNDDCTESIFPSILHGLKISENNSTIFVFTDASTKDKHLLNDIIQLSITKMISVGFFF